MDIVLTIVFGLITVILQVPQTILSLHHLRDREQTKGGTVIATGSTNPKSRDRIWAKFNSLKPLLTAAAIIGFIICGAIALTTSRNVAHAAIAKYVVATNELVDAQKQLREQPFAPQWCLKINRIEYVPTQTIPPSYPPAFRLAAEVNGRDYSFPINGMYFSGLQLNSIDLGEESPLAASQDYQVRFQAIEFRTDRAVILRANMPFDRTNVIMSGFCKKESYTSGDLPAKGTNEVAVSIIGQDSSVGAIKIFYEITSKP
jgi:hypothetical protein